MQPRLAQQPDLFSGWIEYGDGAAQDIVRAAAVPTAIHEWRTRLDSNQCPKNFPLLRKEQDRIERLGAGSNPTSRIRS